MHATSLDAKVAARNRANAYANELHARLAEIFRPLVGAKILKADGTLTKQAAALVPKLPCTPALHVFKDAGDRYLTWCVKACECHPNRYGDGGIANYEAATVRVGVIDPNGGVLTGLTASPELRADYSADEIRAARVAYMEAKNAASEQFNKLAGFGEYDPN